MSKKANPFRIVRGALRVFVALGCWLHSGTAQCESNPLSTNEAEAVARQNFESAVQLSDQGAYIDALLLFQQAYATTPHFSVLFNIAQIQTVLGQDLLALETYSRYLQQAGDIIPAARRKEVEATILALELRLARLDITAQPEACQVLVDGLDVGRAPLQLRVAAGSHTVTVIARGFRWKSQKIDVRRGELVHLSLTLDAEAPPSEPPNAAAAAATTSTPSSLYGNSVQVRPTPVIRVEPDTTTQMWGYLLGGTSLALAGASVTFAFWAEHESSEYRDRQVELNTACFAGQCNAQHAAAQQENNRQLDKVHRLDMATVGLAVGAAATLVAGITWYFRPNLRNGVASSHTNQPLTWRLTF